MAGLKQLKNKTYLLHQLLQYLIIVGLLVSCLSPDPNQTTDTSSSTSESTTSSSDEDSSDEEVEDPTFEITTNFFQDGSIQASSLTVELDTNDSYYLRGEEITDHLSSDDRDLPSCLTFVFFILD